MRTSKLKRTPLKRFKRIGDTGGPYLLKRSAINPKRRAPRRGRIRDAKYLDWCVDQPCCVTGRLPATTHHIRFCGSPKNDTKVIRLVAELHLHDSGPHSIERIGKERFEAMCGISIEGEARKLRERYLQEVKSHA